MFINNPDLARRFAASIFFLLKFPRIFMGSLFFLQYGVAVFFQRNNLNLSVQIQPFALAPLKNKAPVFIGTFFLVHRFPPFSAASTGGGVIFCLDTKILSPREERLVFECFFEINSSVQPCLGHPPSNPLTLPPPPRHSGCQRPFILIC